MNNTLKNWAIAALLVVVAVQGFFLFDRRTVPAPQAPAESAQPAKPGAEPGEATSPPAKARSPEIISFTRDTRAPYGVYFGFNAPAGPETSQGPLERPPFDVSPGIEGEWLWMGPYVLRFTPKDASSLDPAKDYVFTARADLLPQGRHLAGKTAFTLKAQGLALPSVKTELDPVSGKTGQVKVRVFLRFTREVDPKAVLQAVRLVDPKRGPGDPVPLALDPQSDEGPCFDPILTSEPVTAEQTPRTLTVLADAGSIVSTKGYRLTQPLLEPVTVAFSPLLRLVELRTAPGDQNLSGEETPGEVRLRFSSRVAPEALKDVLTVTPQVDFAASRDSGDIVLNGPFKPGQTYAFTLRQGLVAVDGARLEEGLSRSLTMPDAQPRVWFAQPGMFLPKSGSQSVALDAVNLGQAFVRIERVYRNNIFFSLSYYDQSTFESETYGSSVLPYLGETIGEFKVRFAKARNETRQVPLNVGALVKDYAPGFYRVSVGRDQDVADQQRWLLITDIGLAAKRSNDELLVWATSLKDLSALAGAKVTVLSTKNQPLYQGTTDANGLWRGKGLASLDENQQPFLVVVEKGGDMTFLHFERFLTDTTGLDVSGVDLPPSGYQAFAWGERDIYRPGETVRLAVAVRDPALKAPPSIPLKLVYSDAQGREFATDTARTDAQGLATLSRTIPVLFPTGPYAVSILAGEEEIGQYRFEVEDFKPDRITVSVAADKDAAAPGQDLAYTVTGDYLFGAPASGLGVETSARLVKTDFAPKGLEGFVFGDPERAFEPVDLTDATGKLGADGKASFVAAVPQGLKPPAALSAQLTARVSEEGGRGVAARTLVPVHAYAAYPGLARLADSGLAPGVAHAFDYVVVDPQGREIAAKSLVAELYEDRWQTVLRRDGPGYRYETKRDSRLVERRELASPGARGQVSLTPPKFGAYRLRLSDPDSGACAQLSFYARGEGFNPWAVENPAKLEFVAPKADYRPGETARLQVRAPFSGKLLVTVESDTVKDVFVRDMAGNTAEVDVPIRQGYSPNVYVTGVLVRKGADVAPGQAGRAFGTLSLGVGREAGRQEVTILAPETVRPLTRLTVTAKADPGALVTLAVVDEGILQLVAQKTPDPWSTFYAKRALQVNSYDTFALLLPELRARMLRAPAGGDEDMSRFLRTQSPQGEKSVAFWSGPLKADAQGRVQYCVDLPQFQGAVRIMAVAVNGARFGSAQRLTRVKSPLALLPTFPRFAQMGDEMFVGVAVRNDTGKDGAFQVDMSATGPLGVDQGRQTVNVPSGSQVSAVFVVRAAQSEGVGALSVTASGNAETTQARTELLVRSPLPARSVLVSGQAQARTVALGQASDQGFLPGTVRRDLRLGRLPVIRLAGKLENLLGYPYGCAEQTVSKAFPLLYFADLAKRIDPKALADASPQSQVQAGIGRLLTMQTPSGGFTLWPGGETEHAWTTVYATHFLLEASRAGYQVMQNDLNQALSAVAALVKAPRRDDAFKTTAYGLYVLARAGKADKGQMDRLQSKDLDAMSADAVGLLAASYAAVGDTRTADVLLARPGAPAPAEPQADVFDSGLRAQALLTVALADAAPSSPRTAEAARTLARLLESDPAPTTQEAAVAFMALGKLAARDQALPACAGQVLASGKVLAAFDTASILSLSDIRDQGPLSLALSEECRPEAVFYTLETRGIPAPSAFKPESRGLEIQRVFLDRDGKPLDPANLVQGQGVVIKTSVRSVSGPVRHVAVSQLLPTGLEVENPRLASTDRLPWMEAAPAATAYVDMRADRVNAFLDLRKDAWADLYTLCRAVIPGRYALPPAQAEAMYYPELRADTELKTLGVAPGKEGERVAK
ncbi:alpha-2-macroglobulin [Fundidesulfovibrio butyratiphilus]